MMLRSSKNGARSALSRALTVSSVNSRSTGQVLTRDDEEDDEDAVAVAFGLEELAPSVLVPSLFLVDSLLHLLHTQSYEDGGDR